MYRIADGFIHRKIANADIIVSINVATFNGYITINETCAFLFDMMKEPQTVAKALADVSEMLDTFVAKGVVQEVAE